MNVVESLLDSPLELVQDGFRATIESVGTFPTFDLKTALLIGTGVFFVAMLAMNRGDRYFVNLKAQDEPFLVGTGVALFFAPVPDLARVLGLALVLIGFASRYTGLFNINALFGGGDRR